MPEEQSGKGDSRGLSHPNRWETESHGGFGSKSEGMRSYGHARCPGC